MKSPPDSWKSWNRCRLLHRWVVDPGVQYEAVIQWINHLLRRLFLAYSFPLCGVVYCCNAVREYCCYRGIWPHGSLRYFGKSMYFSYNVPCSSSWTHNFDLLINILLNSCVRDPIFGPYTLVDVQTVLPPFNSSIKALLLEGGIARWVAIYVIKGLSLECRCKGSIRCFWFGLLKVFLVPEVAQ